MSVVLLRRCCDLQCRNNSVADQTTLSLNMPQHIASVFVLFIVRPSQRRHMKRWLLQVPRRVWTVDVGALVSFAVDVGVGCAVNSGVD